ncbi:MAG TPA: M48 family metalloprotease [Gammaproteobacteria bacterium]|nr:M48 family metalloprotease [Gammaproteobacteria bacterium]
MKLAPKPTSRFLRPSRWLIESVLVAVLIAGPVHSQGLLNRLKDRLGPASGVVETAIENRAAFEGFTDQEEIEIAKENSGQFEAQADFVDDPRLDAYLNGIVQRLAAHAEPRPFEYRLKVVSDPNINAFTFGGGYLYMNAGLLARMENEAQVAMVLGHEIAHAAESHVTEGMKADAGINLLGQLAGQAAASSGRIDPEVLQKTYEYSMSATINGHGRRQESESDELGLEYMVKAGYDPREASGTFEQLLKEYGDASKMEAFFYSSHPRNEERMARADAWVEANSERFESSSLTVNTEEFRQVTHDVVVAMGKYDYENSRLESARAMFEKAAGDGVDDPVPHEYLELIDAATSERDVERALD